MDYHVHYLTVSDTATHLLMPVTICCFHTFDRMETSKGNQLKSRSSWEKYEFSIVFLPKKGMVKSDTQHCFDPQNGPPVFIRNLWKRHHQSWSHFHAGFLRCLKLNLQTVSCEVSCFQGEPVVKSANWFYQRFSRFFPCFSPPLWVLWLSSAPRLLPLVLPHIEASIIPSIFPEVAFQDMFRLFHRHIFNGSPWYGFRPTWVKKVWKAWINSGVFSAWSLKDDHWKFHQNKTVFPSSYPTWKTSLKLDPKSFKLEKNCNSHETPWQLMLRT